MARDMENKRRLDDKWKKENTLQIGVRLQNSTGIPSALQKAIEEQNVTKNAYAVQAIREKLQRDGFDPEQYKLEE